MDATTVATRLRRSSPTHDAYTVRIANHRVATLVTAHPADARRWVRTTRWLHGSHIRSGRLVVGLGVQWTPPARPLHGAPPPPATLQLSAGHRCLVFQLAQADDVPDALRRFLADPRVTFVGSGSRSDQRMLRVHYDLDVASGRELRALAGMGNASMERMADRFLGYPGIDKPKNVAMSAWHAPDLSPEQVEYACVDAYLAFRLGVHLCPRGARALEPEHPPVSVGVVPPDERALLLIHTVPTVTAAESDADSEWSSKTVGTRVDSGASDTDTGTVDDSASDLGEIGAYLPYLSIAHPSSASGDDNDGGLSDGYKHIGSGAVTEEDDDYEEHVRIGVLTVHDEDEEEVEEEDDYEEHVKIGVPTVDDEDDEEVVVEEDDDEEHVKINIGLPTIDDEEVVEEEHVRVGVLSVEDEEKEEVEGYEHYVRIGVVTGDDEEYVGNAAATVDVKEEDEEGGLGLGGYQASEYLGNGAATVTVEKNDSYEQFGYLGHAETMVYVEEGGGGYQAFDDYFGGNEAFDVGDFSYDYEQDDGYEEYYVL